MSNHELPRYRCFMEVRAIKIKEVIKHAHPCPDADDAAFEASPAFQGAHLMFDGHAPIPVDADWYRRHDPDAGGYYVVHADGSASYCPAAWFESACTRIDQGGTP